MIDVRSVRHRAGGALILDDVTVRFRPQRFNVILGPNGAGKSTLLKIATGLLRPEAGSVYYGERPLADFDADELARTRAVLSQHVELAFPLSVYDVVLMGRYPHYGRAPGVWDREVVARALELVGMVDQRDQPYPTLSGGEQQKVQLARVLAQIWDGGEGGAEDVGAGGWTDGGIGAGGLAPGNVNNRHAVDSGAGDGRAVEAGVVSAGARGHTYLFLDEPTSSLDIHYQIHLLDIARGLLRHDCTIVAILHDLNVAFQYGDSFCILEGGRVVCDTDRASDVPRELIERVFRVRARRVVDAEAGSMGQRGARGDGAEGFWRFSL